MVASLSDGKKEYIEGLFLMTNKMNIVWFAKKFL